MAESNYISIKGAKVNNLKNIDVDIPRNKLVVITGLSGSMPKDNGAMWKAFPRMPASSSEE